MSGKKIISLMLGCAGLAELLLALYAFVFNYLCMDHAEHLHAAWLVWQGEVPYRDFFEHHNPLLWFLLAPLTAVFYQNALILYVGRVVSAIAYGIVFAGAYKVCRRFLAMSGRAFAVAVVFYFIIPENLYLLFELQPDQFMLAALFWGIYFLFSYVETKKALELNVAFLLFIISFLFLQKAVLLLAYVGVYVCYLLYKKELSWTVLLRALIAPALCVFVLYIYLFYTNSLNLYLLFNYDLNFWMQKFYGDGRIFENLTERIILPAVAVMTLHTFLANGNEYRNVLAGIAFANYGSLFLTGAPFNQYFIFVNIVSAIVAGDYVADKLSYKRVQLLVIALLGIGVFVWYHKLPNKYFSEYYNAHKYVMAQTTDDDQIMNSVMVFYNIYGRNVSYYWFGYGNITPVAYLLYEYEEEFNPDKIIYEQRPKFVSKAVYKNLNIFKGNKNIYSYQKYLEKIWAKLGKTGNKDEFVEKWSDIYYYRQNYDLIDKYYVKTPYYPLMIRNDSM